MQKSSSLDNSENPLKVENSKLDNGRQSNEDMIPDSPNQLSGSKRRRLDKINQPARSEQLHKEKMSKQQST